MALNSSREFTMSEGPEMSHPSGYQGDAINGTEQDKYPDLLASSSDWTLKSPSYFPNSSSIPPVPTSGLVPGLIAAGIFIFFLLCLYALLWKCMVSPPNNRKRKKRSSSSAPTQKPLVL